MPAFGKCWSLRSMKYPNSRAGSLTSPSMSGPAAAKSVVGWRFAPACCAAQAVGRAQRRSSALRSTQAPLHKATKSLEGLCLLYPTHRAPSSSSWKTSVTPRWQTRLATCGRSGKPERLPVRCTPKKMACALLAWRVQWLMAAKLITFNSAGDG